VLRQDFGNSKEKTGYEKDMGSIGFVRRNIFVCTAGKN
jgi:hypothetical protein